MWDAEGQGDDVTPQRLRAVTKTEGQARAKIDRQIDTYPRTMSVTCVPLLEAHSTKCNTHPTLRAPNHVLFCCVWGGGGGGGGGI